MDKISYSPQVCDEPAAIFQRVEFPRTSRVPRRTERTERPLFIRGGQFGQDQFKQFLELARSIYGRISPTGQL